MWRASRSSWASRRGGVVGLGLHLGEPRAELCAARPGPQRRTGALVIAHDDRRFTTVEDIDYVVSTLKDRVAKLRELSPLWEMYKDGVDISAIQWTAH